MAGVLITPETGEPTVSSWRVGTPDEVARDLLAGAGAGRRVIAVDGRSGAGKTTLARLLQEQLPGAALVSTDDVAWHHSLFDWAELLIEGVLHPFRCGETVRFRPPAWEERDRAGAIDVPESATALLIEGVGASQQSLSAWVDNAIWVQSNAAEAERLGIARDIASGVNGDRHQSIAFWHAWMDEERPFLERDRPWQRADLIVAGTSATPVPAGQIAVATIATPRVLQHARSGDRGCETRAYDRSPVRDLRGRDRRPARARGGLPDLR